MKMDDRLPAPSNQEKTKKNDVEAQDQRPVRGSPPYIAWLPKSTLSFAVRPTERSKTMSRSALRTICVVVFCSSGFVLTGTARAGEILKVSRDGTNPAVLVPNVPGSLVELDLDLPAGKMYWMTSVGIFNANLNGSGVHELLPVGPLGTLGKADMILTPNLIVWTENGNVYRANLDGSDKQEIFQASSSAGAVTSLAYDNVTGTLYTYGRSDPNSVNDGYGFVRSMNLDGSNIKTLIDSGLGTITYGFAVSDSLNRMYIGGHMAMWYANLDGSGLTKLPLDPYYDGTIRIDESTSTIYYRDDVIYQGIRSANLDGSNLQNVYQGPVSGFQLDTESNTFFILSSAGGSAVPEPSSLLIGATGAVVLLGYGCWRRFEARAIPL
jgi:hypothetical protein